MRLHDAVTRDHRLPDNHAIRRAVQFDATEIIGRLPSGHVDLERYVTSLDGARPPYGTMWVEFALRGKLNGAFLISKDLPDADSVEVRIWVFSGERFVPLGFVFGLARDTGRVRREWASVPIGDVPVSDLQRSGATAIALCALALCSFANLKNAREVVHQPPRQARRAAEREGRDVATLTYRTIEIVLPKSQRVYETLPNGERRELPWHRVRGHIATYEPDRPMFGRPGAHGRFWVPAHARGAKRNGIVVSDYRIADRSSSAE